MAKSWNKVVIVGVGLIGASIGLAIKNRKLAKKVVGVGRRFHVAKTAMKMNAIDEATTKLAPAVADADLVVVCTPPEIVIEKVKQIAEFCPTNCLITDAASTKFNIVSTLQRTLPSKTRFVGSHPMAGGHTSGPGEAKADLFVDKTVVVCALNKRPPAIAAEATTFWESLGAQVIRKSAKAHDDVVAATSHLPHLIAYALALATKNSTMPLIGSGWLDTTRIAQADQELWLQILKENRRNVLAAAKHFQSKFDLIVKALDQGDDDQLRRLLKKGKVQRDTAETVAG